MNGRPYDHYTYRGKPIVAHAHPHGGRKAAPSQRKTVGDSQRINGIRTVSMSEIRAARAKAGLSNPQQVNTGTKVNATNLSATQGRNIAKASLDKEAGRISKEEYKRIVSENTTRAPGATRVQGGSTEVPRTEFKPAPQAAIGKANNGDQKAVGGFSEGSFLGRKVAQSRAQRQRNIKRGSAYQVRANSGKKGS